MKKRKWSLYFGKISGTEISVHWTFLVLVLLVFFSSYREHSSWAQAVLAVSFLLALFVCITLHEFGHILVARRYGAEAKSVTLYPIGGMARMKKIPEKPMEEFWMALAGPWVNVVLAAVIYSWLFVMHGVPVLGQIPALSRETFLYSLMMYNLALALFNLLPAFPMDGGRMLRALLSLRMPRVRATVIAARTGQLLAAALILFGLFYNVSLTLIGFFIFFVAGEEMLLEISKASLQDYKVQDALMHGFTSFSSDETLGKAVQVMLDVPQKEFPVTENGELRGIVSSKMLIQALLGKDRNSTLQNVMNQEVQVLHPGTPLSEALQKMMLHEQDIYPVVEHGKLLGMLDIQNVNEFSAVKGIGRQKEGLHPQVT